MRRYWQSKTRFYRTEVTQDLFGTWLVVRCWGSRFSAHGQIKTTPVDSYAAAIQVTHIIAKTRVQHGYQELPIHRFLI